MGRAEVSVRAAIILVAVSSSLLGRSPVLSIVSPAELPKLLSRVEFNLPDRVAIVEHYRLPRSAFGNGDKYSVDAWEYLALRGWHSADVLAPCGLSDVVIDLPTSTRREELLGPQWPTSEGVECLRLFPTLTTDDDCHFTIEPESLYLFADLLSPYEYAVARVAGCYHASIADGEEGGLGLAGLHLARDMGQDAVIARVDGQRGEAGHQGGSLPGEVGVKGEGGLFCQGGGGSEEGEEAEDGDGQQLR